MQAIYINALIGYTVIMGMLITFWMDIAIETYLTFLTGISALVLSHTIVFKDEDIFHFFKNDDEMFF